MRIKIGSLVNFNLEIKILINQICHLAMSKVNMFLILQKTIGNNYLNYQK